MMQGNFGWRVLAVVGMTWLLACTSRQAETRGPESRDATGEAPTAGQDAGPVVKPPPETHRPGRRCGPDEMECCGACIPKSEKVCPVNVHCPTSAPEM